jgi:hypothetical protein
VRPAAIASLAAALLGCAATPSPVTPPPPSVSPPPPPAPAPLRVRAHDLAANPPPAFPAGWVRNAPSLALPTSTDRIPAITTDLPPSPVAPTALRLADLPSIEITPPLDAAHPPRAPLSTPFSEEIFIAHGCSRASVKNHDFGFIQVGWFSLPITAQSGGGVSLWGVHGGDGRETYTFAGWQTIERGEGESILFEQTDGWFNMLTCKMHEARKVRVLARPIAGGLAYGFIASCPDCAPKDRRQLHLLWPESGLGGFTFTHRAVSLFAGMADSAAASVTSAGLDRLRRAGAASTRTGDASFMIEIVQGTGEAEPTATISVRGAPPERS